MPKILDPKTRRLRMIAQRQNQFEHIATQRDEASLTRDLDEDDLDERRRIGQQAGANWVAQHRGQFER